MKKLTKEQADWLLGELMEAKDYDGPDTYVSYKDATKIINQCTEKEFSKFEMWHDGSWKMCANFDEDADSVRFDLVSGHNVDYCFYMGAKDIRSFASNINKIVEWLEEPE